MTTFLHLRSGASGPQFVGTNQDDTLLWDAVAKAWFVGPVSTAGAVTSVFGRPGPAVVAQTGDYNSDEVTNASTVPGVAVSDALENAFFYAPGIPSDWGATPPTTKDAALDRLASISNLEQHAAGALGPAATITFTTPNITPKRSGTYLVLAYISGTANGATTEALELLADAASIAQARTGTGDTNEFTGALMATATVTTGAPHTYTVRATAGAGTNSSAAGEVRIVTLELGG